jgi:glutathione S-transferase
MLQLHYFPGNASLIVHIVLEELGAPYELKYVDRAVTAQKSPAYLALNPNGLIPVLVDTRPASEAKRLVLYETAAVALHLADTHASAGLLPPLGSAERALAYKWLAWLTNTLQATLIVYFYPERWADDVAAVAQVKAHAEAKVGAMLDQLDAEFARHGGPWLLGSDYGLADPYAFVLCRWTRGFGQPARERAHLKPWLERTLARPAVQRAFAQEGLTAPWF